MPLEDDDQRRVDQVMEEMGADKSGTRLLVLGTSQTQRLGFWMVVCIVVNRSIGVQSQVLVILNHLNLAKFIRLRLWRICDPGNPAKGHRESWSLALALGSWCHDWNMLASGLA